ncbi:MAG: translocation/assembly module TamB domain-containing protein [Paludibacteraceae bacterium]
MQVKRKGTKKSAKITLIVIASFCVLLVTPIILLKFNKIQNFVVQKITVSLSQTLHTTVAVGQVDLHLFGTLTLRDVFVADQQGDTLLCADELNARMAPIALLYRELHFVTAELVAPHIEVRVDSVGVPNFAFLTELLPDSANADIGVRFDRLELCRGTVAFVNEQAAAKTEHKNMIFDVNNVKISDLNAFAKFRLTRDKHLKAQLQEFSFSEQSGFRLDNLTAMVEMNDSMCFVPQLEVNLSHSHIAFDTISVSYAALEQHLQRSERLRLNARLKKSNIYLPDLKMFTPELGRLRRDLVVSGTLSGNLANLKAYNLHAQYGNGIVFDGDFRFTGLPDIQETFIDARLNEITFTPLALQDLAAQLAQQPVVLPEQMHRLGTCRYSGSIIGFVSHLVLNGRLATNAGIIRTDVDMMLTDNFDNLEVDGDVRSQRIRLSMITPPEFGLGDVSFDTDTRLQLHKDAPLSVKSDLVVHSIAFKDHVYKNIAIAGDYTDRKFVGTAAVDDENLQFDFTGEIELNKDNYVFNFDVDVDDFRPYALNLIDNNPNLTLSTHLNSRFEGPNADAMAGYIRLSNLHLDNDVDFFLNELIFTSQVGDTHDLLLQSDLINASLTGNYKFASLFESCKQTFYRYFPVFGDASSASRNESGNALRFRVAVGATDRLMASLDIPWFTTDTLLIEGFYDDVADSVVFSMATPQVRNRTNSKFCNLGIDIDNADAQLHCRLRGQSVTRKNDTISCFVSLAGRNDSLTADLQWHNIRSELTHAGEVLLRSHFVRRDDRLQADVHLLPTQIVLQNTPFDLSAADIHTDFRTVEVNQLNIQSDRQHIFVEGTASQSENDSISVDLQNISLDFISTLIPPTTQITFGGEVSGTASVKRAFDRPIILAKVSGESFSFNDAYLGSVRARSWWNNTTKSLDFSGRVMSDARDTVAKINGGYFFSNDSLDLIGHADHLDIKFIEPFMASILQNIKGTASGDVHVYGHTQTQEVSVTVEAMAENAQAGIDFLGATFFFNDSVILTPTEIILSDIDVLDTEGNHATLNGLLKHRYFKDLDYRIDINCRNFKALNTTAKDNDLFYGTAYATGNAVITGNDEHTNIMVNATTEKNTKLIVPIGASVATENSFITFVDHNKPIEAKTEIDPFAQPDAEKTSELKLNLMVNVTPNAEVQIYVDPKAGDVLKATGDGDIRIEYNDKTDDFKMYGSYEIEQGSYLFSFQEAIRKEFKVKQGGTVDWSGDPVNPHVNIDGYYQLNASLLDILDQSYLESSNRTTVPVQCLLNLTGNLSNPTIKFGINLPNSDEELNRALQTTISTDEMMTREIIYLLVLGKFFTPETMKSTGTVFTQGDLLAVASSTVSAQLNNWASQMFDNWNFGVNFRSTDLGDSYSNEYEFNFLYTPNNRISINGNVGYRDDNLSASKFIGDFDFEYKLIQSGKLSAKAYTHTNDYKEFKTALTTQGIGLVYRESFDSGKDLLNNWKKSIADSKKERAARRAKREQRRAERRAAKQQSIAPTDSIAPLPTDTVPSDVDAQ